LSIKGFGDGFGEEFGEGFGEGLGSGAASITPQPAIATPRNKYGMRSMRFGATGDIAKRSPGNRSLSISAVPRYGFPARLFLMGDAMTARAVDLRDAAIRHDRRVHLSVLALGLAPERAGEITQAAGRLVDPHQRGPGNASGGNPDACAGRAPPSRISDERTAHRALQPQPARSPTRPPRTEATCARSER
jgi:hypothetical protein